jgi:hypothetical protein
MTAAPHAILIAKSAVSRAVLLVVTSFARHRLVFRGGAAVPEFCGLFLAPKTIACKVAPVAPNKSGRGVFALLFIVWREINVLASAERTRFQFFHQLFASLSINPSILSEYAIPSPYPLMYSDALSARVSVSTSRRLSAADLLTSNFSFGIVFFLHQIQRMQGDFNSGTLTRDKQVALQGFRRIVEFY